MVQRLEDTLANLPETAKPKPKKKIPDYRVPSGPGSYMERRAQVSPFAYEKVYGCPPPDDWPGWNGKPPKQENN